MEGPKQVNSSVDVFDRHKAREALFVSAANTKALEAFENALLEADVSQDDFERWREAVSKLDSEVTSAFLAIPHELRATRVRALIEQSKKSSIEKVVQESAERMYSEGYRIGYHCSPSPNHPKQDNRTGRETWTIDGFEPDHRDGDLGMAYYSLDLTHLYHSKNPQYIYLVCAHIAPEGTHRQDNDGAWGRAPKLDVIDVLDYHECMKSIDSKIAELKASE